MAFRAPGGNELVHFSHEILWRLARIAFVARAGRAPESDGRTAVDVRPGVVHRVFGAFPVFPRERTRALLRHREHRPSDEVVEPTSMCRAVAVAEGGAARAELVAAKLLRLRRHQVGRGDHQKPLLGEETPRRLPCARLFHLLQPEERVGREAAGVVRVRKHCRAHVMLILLAPREEAHQRRDARGAWSTAEAGPCRTCGCGCPWAGHQYSTLSDLKPPKRPTHGVRFRQLTTSESSKKYSAPSERWYRRLYPSLQKLSTPSSRGLKTHDKWINYSSGSRWFGPAARTTIADCQSGAREPLEARSVRRVEIFPAGVNLRESICAV